MSVRIWLSVITAILLGMIIYVSRSEIAHAWRLLEQVNIWALLLLIPGQILVYYAAGEMIFSYLRSKKAIKQGGGPQLARLALEMNFVNHILPSGGVSGLSYMNWRLKHFGVRAGQATMAQIVRFATGFLAFAVLLVISVIAVTIDTGVNRWVILLSATLIGLMMIATGSGMYLLGSRRRIERFSRWSFRLVNKIVRKVTFGRIRQLLTQRNVEVFFMEMHDDYLALRREKKVLLKPFLWGLVFTVAEALLFLITFWSMGAMVNPAIILIAYGLAAVAGFVVATPGGVGAYEAIMVSFLAIAGVPGGVAIAGILLTRIILLLGTILFGYAFYQHAILRHGRARASGV